MPRMHILWGYRLYFKVKPIVLKAMLLIGTGFTLKPLVLKALLLIGTGFTMSIKNNKILFLTDYKSFKNNMHSTGIEPVSTPWKGAILPLNYECV